METHDENFITSEFTPQAVILAAGDYPSHPIPCALLTDAEFVACCDSSADEYIANGGIPGIIVGDGDSISEENRKRFADILEFEEEQDYNDLTKTMRALRRRGITRVAIVGATGKREDHTLGNISLLLFYKEMGFDVRMFTDYGVFIPIHGNCTFDSFPRQQVSIFNFTAKGLDSNGLVYPLSDFTSWWQGTLNESQGNLFSIYANGSYITFLTYSPKQ